MITENIPVAALLLMIVSALAAWIAWPAFGGVAFAGVAILFLYLAFRQF